MGMTGRALQKCHNIYDLRKLAKRRLPSPIFGYIDGGSDDEETLKRNTEAFSDYELIPRTLVDVENIDMKTRVMGVDLEWPVFASPTGMGRLFHHDGELAVARATAAAGTLFSLSTIASTSIEDIAAASTGPKMFQIYVQRDRGPVSELIARCKAAEYDALCLTVDLPVHGNRERDLYTGMTVPPRLTLMSMLDVLMHPAWCWNYISKPPFTMANFDYGDLQGQELNSLMKYVSKMFDRSVTWKDAEWMVQEWGGPFVIKGILSVDDARRAADIGATAVMVSNHGGRQLDGVPAPFDQIAEIADAVGDRIEIICDGGIRRGKHVLKALAVGATACSVGRAYLYGLGAGGEAGVARAFSLLRAEVERGMALLGCRNVAEITRQHIRRVR